MVQTGIPPQIDDQQPQLALHWQIVLGIVVFVGIAIGATVFMKDGPDWHLHYYPAGELVWQGKNIYEMEYIFPNPPWAVVLPAVLALLPMQIGRGIWFAMGFLSYVVIAYKLGARGIGLIAFMLAPPVIHDLLNANLNWLVLWGLVLPLQWGIIALVLKPQVGGFAALFGVIQTWREESLVKAIQTVIPTLILTLLGIVFYGVWFVTILSYTRSENHFNFNSSLWPLSIPFGLIALVVAWRRNDITWAIAAGPLLSPYVSFHSFVAILIPFCKSQKQMVVVVSIFWLLALWTAFSGGA